MRESSAIIDGYARGEGATWSTLRKSCGLEVAPAKGDILKPRIHDEVEIARIMTHQLSDALAIAAIDQNAEVIRNQPSLGALWKLLAHPNKVDAHQGYAKAAFYFGKMMAASLWIPRGKSHKSHQQYCPSL